MQRLFSNLHGKLQKYGKLSPAGNCCQRAKRYLTAVGKYDIFNLLCSCVNIVICAGIAQSVEQLIRNQQVVSSSLISSSTKKDVTAGHVLFCLCARGCREVVVLRGSTAFAR